MQKRVVSKTTKGLSLLEISLLLTMSVAFSFILSESLPVVSAEKVSVVSLDGEIREVDSGSSDYTSLIASGWTLFKGNAKNAVPTILNTPGATSSINLVEATKIAGEQGKGLFGTVEGYEGINVPGTKVKVPFTQAPGVANLVANVGHALLWAGIANMAARLFGANSQQAGAISTAVGAGVFAAKTLTSLFGKGGIFAKSAFGQSSLGNFLGAYANPIGIAIAVIVFVLSFKKTKQEVITFQCLPWEPPLGGAKCEECNKDPLKPCNEYRCRALGQSCQLLNANTERPQCAWISKSDTQSPTITPWNEALKPTSLQYTASSGRPESRGVRIVSPEANGCLQAFTALQFGVTTNEPAQCKIDYNRSVNFDSMAFYMGDNNYYQYNHSQRLRLPDPTDPDNDLGPLLQNDGTFSFFIRCRDGNGNVNVDEFSVNFCVNAGPDTTPPIIEGSSIEDGSPVQFGVDQVPIEIYTNEPAQCRWSHNDRAYEDMENIMGCATDATQINGDLQFTCAGPLFGVEDRAESKFYFRCEDQPTKPENERNTMTQSYELTLRGTQPLSLLKLGPNGTTITASTSYVPITLTAETDDGANNGEAVCYFSASGEEAGNYIEYYDTGSIQHNQPLSLIEGDYTMWTRCVDAGGNSASGSVSFSVKVDKTMPIVTRVYKKGTDTIQLVTSEPARCYYSRTSCNYEIEEGLSFANPTNSQENIHVAAWKDNSPYFVKCMDPYGNQPSPNDCSIIVSGVDLSVKAVV